jgi:hypothetical protein
MTRAMVLCHIGNTWPDHINTCINHTRQWFGGKIYIIVNRANINCINNTVDIVEIESLYSTFLDEFNKIDFFSAYGLGGFWRYAFERLLLLEALMAKKNLEEVIHIENDVLIYYDPLTINFRCWYKNRVAFNPLGDNYCTAAHIYVDNHKSLSIINGLLINLIRLGTSKLAGMFPGISPINEMMLLSILLKQKQISYLPINVIGNYSDNLDDFNMVFDPASWGQYIGGTPQGHESGILFDHHWIGLDMKNRSIEIKWKRDEKERKFPLLCYNNREYKFANLHIHNKKLFQYC